MSDFGRNAIGDNRPEADIEAISKRAIGSIFFKTDMTRSRIAAVSLMTACLVATAAAWYLSYLAGCTGDTKGGALGDPVRALEIESYALVPELLALLCLAGLPLAHGKISHPVQFSVAVLLFVIGLPVLIFTGIHFEAMGVRVCFVN